MDGHQYEIDLSAGNADRLRATLARYVHAARTTSKGPRRVSPPVRQAAAIDPAQSRQIRAWAAASGHTVSARGRIPLAVQDAYQAALGR